MWIKQLEGENQIASKDVLAFGYGPRVCPGRELAYLELKTFMAVMLRRFEVSCPVGYSLSNEEQYNIVAKTENDVLVRLSRWA